MDLLNLKLERDKLEQIRSGEKTGRPLGGKQFVALLEEITGRSLIKKKAGPQEKLVNSYCAPRYD